MARAMRMSPLAIAEKGSRHIVAPPQVDKVRVAPPGFINFPLGEDWLGAEVESILAAGESYGDIEIGKGTRIQLEFVSVNPTGPLHVGHGRGAVLGSTLANVLNATGYGVEKEFYINDAGSQLDAFSRSLYARYQQGLGIDAEMPSDGYMGNYMVDLAKEIIDKEGKRFSVMLGDKAIKELGSIGVSKIMDMIRHDLELLGGEFDEIG